MRLALAVVMAAASLELHAALPGAWQHTGGDGAVMTLIIADGHFALAQYRKEPAKFVATAGGSWKQLPDGVSLAYEFDTATPERVGTVRNVSAIEAEGRLTFDGREWTRVDDGTPGALQGSWLMTGRKRDGQVTTRTPGARRTMKILSGTRFQWIAYNVETKEFFGTGGGTYTTKDGAYTESLEFFSRDDAKAGRTLPFRYELSEGAWQHIGSSTAGEPMHEIWRRRRDLGI
jgi:hypothetical protein